MLQCFAQSACNAILLKLHDGVKESTKGKALVGCTGITQDVPLSPLKAKAATQVAVAQADNAEVDLTAWALPSETVEQAKARVILR